MVDLGSIELESDTNLISTLPQEEAALYECLRLCSKDISAYVVDGEFSFTGLEAAGASAIAEVCRYLLMDSAMFMHHQPCI